MKTFRIYEVDPGGHIVGPSLAIECDADEQAIEEAKQRLGLLALEIWRGNELVMRLEPAGPQARSAAS
jgi:hypothetical protein